MRFLFAFSAFLTGIAAAALFAVSGLHVTLEQQWREAIHEWSPREASGQVHVVEIDAASLAAVNRWPWPRQHYANVVKRLDEAGVRSIAFDIDFSSPSAAGDDAAFAAALERAKTPVYLPTFSQAASANDRRALEALPIEPLRRSVSLASVMMRPDADGFVRSLPMGAVTGDMPRPSLAAASSGANGAVDEIFALDLSVDPATIPRHSFVKIERGRFDPDELRGKDVIIGATAIELFDRYPVPLHGVIPGAVVQALGVETLLAGRFVEIGWILPLAFAALISVWILGAQTSALAAARGGTIIVSLMVAGFCLQAVSRIAADIVPALVCVIAVTGMIIARHLHHDFQHRRLYDPGTDLQNRRAFVQRPGIDEERLTIAMALDNYEALRAVLGEDGSDTLIRRMADRVTEYDASVCIFRVEERVLAWTVSALGYDPDQELAKLAKLLRAPMYIDNRAVDTDLTFGVASKDALNEAIHAARVAATQKRTVSFHADTEQENMERRVSLLGELEGAIEREELQVWFQPQLDLGSNEIASVEALVRWQHPTRGFLAPGHFIPLAEKSNRIDSLTIYVLRKSIDALMAWCDEGIVLRAAVNISARLLSSRSFIREIEQLVSTSGIPRDRLVFEITESATLDDPEESTAALHRLRALGIAISIDDYGTGQSSLSYLKTMPLSELKIDRSFVQHAHKEVSDAMLVRSTIQLAHELGLTVVAEGVEHAECLEFLRSAGCDIAQGYLIGKPMTFDDIRTITAEYSRKVA
ncbi:hypothetical protein GCM10010923_19530 [Blastomonas marina]|uniref:EAL domain-containing protein n=1 Tax=Blastomonas marina TaxID=1867408 RepID=A0ABQ1FEF2_9SPHN|nr:EAL domain-containing protein [Blastomonas marina]GGA09271.1 hypothetical protein GCM10010923_19530 [Blastomonas marina]